MPEHHIWNFNKSKQNFGFSLKLNIENDKTFLLKDSLYNFVTFVAS